MEIETQKKKNPNDPDYDQLNQEIIKLAHTNGNVRQAIILYLTGSLTWIEAMELMVTTIHKEFKLQQSLLNVVIQEQEVPRDLLEAYARRTHKRLPAPSLPPEEATGHSHVDCPQIQDRGDGGVSDRGTLRKRDTGGDIY